LYFGLFERNYQAIAIVQEQAVRTSIVNVQAEYELEILGLSHQFLIAFEHLFQFVERLLAMLFVATKSSQLDHVIFALAETRVSLVLLFEVSSFGRGLSQPSLSHAYLLFGLQNTLFGSLFETCRHERVLVRQVQCAIEQLGAHLLVLNVDLHARIQVQYGNVLAKRLVFELRFALKVDSKVAHLNVVRH
jgi:hypothetical protein